MKHARRLARHGWRRDRPDHRDHRYATPAAVLRAMPPRVDLRAGMPPVYDQGTFSSCTGNAISAALVYLELAAGQPLWTPARLFLYYNERAREGDVNTDGGAEIRDGVAALCTEGVCDEALWPYDEDHLFAKPSDACYAAARAHTATRYMRVAQTLTELKGCLAQGFPIICGMSVFESFESAAVRASGMVPMPNLSERMLGGHCVLLVGYDDARGAFVLRNSWGAGWGLGGYCYLPYPYVLDGGLTGDFWAIRAAR